MKAKLIKEVLFEFERGNSDTFRNLDIGNRQKIYKEFENIDGKKEEIEISINNVIFKKKYIDSWKVDKLLEIQKKYLSKEENVLLDRVRNRSLSTKGIIEEAIKDGVSLEVIKEILDAWGTEDHQSKGKIILSKIGRTKEEKKFDEKNNIYVFIGFTEKKPVTVNGKQYYEDKFSTEGVIKIDKFNPSDLMQIPMMKTRAKAQYPDGGVYMIHIPKDWMDEDHYTEIPEDFYEVILDHMKKI